MKTICNEEHRHHFPVGELSGGQMVRPFECPERWDHIVTALAEQGFSESMAPDPLDLSNVQSIHSAPYLNFLEEAFALWQASGAAGDAIPTMFSVRGLQRREPREIDGRLGFFALSSETAITAGTWRAACASAAIAQTGARLLNDGDRSAFALCRPPGHHATTDMFGGYCFLNNAALAAQRLLDTGAARVAILDVDFHHGNGTQDIFDTRDDVLFLSLHGHPEDAFPYFLGYADETGHGAGEGFTVNFPLRPGTHYEQWSAALELAIKRIETYAPDALVVSLGVDTFEKDPISFFKLTSDDFSRYGQRLAQLALPTLFVMEGGYAVAEVGLNTVNVLRGFAGTG